jgi:phosphotransferase system enzyme I (PtsI)
MAGDPVMIPLLLGLGVNELSVAPPSVAQVKYLIRRLKRCEAQALTEFALTCDSGAEILTKADAFVRERAPGLFESRT